MRTAAILAVAAGFALVVPGAPAYVAPGARIVSASFERLEQADDTTSQIALSGDGRHVVFTTRARNLFPDGFADPADAFTQGGIFRQDLETNRLELVAAGDVRPEAAPETLRTRGALNPSVSADGRFVAFSTGERLVPADDNGNVDVYVRDLRVPASDQRAYDLVSAPTPPRRPSSIVPARTRARRPPRARRSRATGATSSSAPPRRATSRRRTPRPRPRSRCSSATGSSAARGW
ncbi:MAG: hypothetical protein MUC84_07980 [Solirubrobacteraceae bacterium]|nr:hypothetical protein [Solirubrobacteraceae bacterium]